MKVSLRGPGSAPLPPQISAAPPALKATGPAVVLGGHDAMAGAIAPAADSLFGPRGAALLAPDGPLFVADTGHHRLLGWRRRPERDAQPAELLIGQPDWGAEGRNAGQSDPSASSLNVPTGVASIPGGGLAVADAWNNRVLIWRSAPTTDHQPADIVLGQSDFEGQLPNGGERDASARSMHWPFQVLALEDRFYVADAGNRRILGWHRVPDASTTPADFVLGQPDLDSRSDNSGDDASACTFRWPHDLTVWNGNLCLSDAGNNRVLVWDGLPADDNVPARHVIGQSDFVSVDHNRGSYWPDASTLNMPYALQATPAGLLIGDTASSRLVLYTSVDEPAVALTGQDQFGMKGDNRYQAPVRDSLCWPYGLSCVGSTVVVADTGNHRVCLWEVEGADAG